MYHLLPMHFFHGSGEWLKQMSQGFNPLWATQLGSNPFNQIISKLKLYSQLHLSLQNDPIVLGFRGLVMIQWDGILLISKGKYCEICASIILFYWEPRLKYQKATMAGHSSLMLGRRWTDLSVLDSRLFGQASAKSCLLPKFFLY